MASYELPESFETPEERRERKNNEKFQALGKFVQAFELMVAEVRDTCRDLVSDDQANRKLLDTILHHRVLTAQPLFEVMRALYAERLLGADSDVVEAEREAISSVLTQLATEYQDLVKRRNSVVHGTWLIGWVNMTAESVVRELFVQKKKVTGKGLADEDLPKDVKDLQDLTKQCNDVKLLIAALYQNFSMFGRITNALRQVDGVWIYTPLDERPDEEEISP